MEKKKINVLAIVLVIILLVFVIAFVCCLSLGIIKFEKNVKVDDNDKINNNTVVNEEKQENNTASSESKANKYAVIAPPENIKVYSYIDIKKYNAHGGVKPYGKNENSSFEISLRIPQINSQKEGAKKLNEKILSSFAYFLIYFDDINDDKSATDARTVVDYKTFFQDEGNIIISSTVTETSTNGRGGQTHYTFIYNEKEDKEVSVKDYLISKNVTASKIRERLVEAIRRDNQSISENEQLAGFDEKISDYTNISIEDVSINNNLGSSTIISATLRVDTVGRASYLISIDF